MSESATLHSNSMDDDSMMSLDAMLLQEENGYETFSNYMKRVPHINGKVLPQSPIDEQCRSLMVGWCNSIVDYCHYSHEIVEIAMSCVDRFLSTSSGYECLLSREAYQLVVLTAIYTTAKVHEREPLDPSSIAKLSRGKHTKKDVEKMEFRMLQALRWKVNPPTSIAFVQQILKLLPANSIEISLRKTILKLTNYQIELAVTDYEMSRQKSSSIAVAALLNAIACVDPWDNQLLQFLQYLSYSSFQIDSDKLQRIKVGLYDLVSKQPKSSISDKLLMVQRRSPCRRSTKRSRSSKIPTHDSPRMVTMSID